MSRIDRLLALLAGTLIVLVQLMAVAGLLLTLVAPAYPPSWAVLYAGMATNTAVGLLALSSALLCLLVLITHPHTTFPRGEDDR